MPERWVFPQPLDAEALVTRGLHNFVSQLWSEYEYDQRNVRYAMRKFLEHVASMPCFVPVVKIDWYFVRVYKYFARQEFVAWTRLTVLRGFAQSYSYLTRSRARTYWATQLEKGSRLYAESNQRMEDLYKRFLDTGSLAENFEYVKKAVYYHVLLTEKWEFAQERSRAAAEDCE